MPNRYVYAINSALGFRVFSVYVPYLGMVYVICVTGMVAMYAVVLHLYEHQIAGILYNIKCTIDPPTQGDTRSVYE